MTCAHLCMQIYPMQHVEGMQKIDILERLKIFLDLKETSRPQGEYVPVRKALGVPKTTKTVEQKCQGVVHTSILNTLRNPEDTETTVGVVRAGNTEEVEFEVGVVR